MPELSLVQLRHFCAVAEHGSIAEAARMRHVSATAVGAAITNLESVLGTRLCQRERSRGVELTPAGQSFYREAQELLRTADDLVHSRIGGPTGPLHLGAFAPIAPAILPDLLARFGERYPDIEVTFSTALVDELIQQVVSGQMHCMFGYDVFQRQGILPPGLTVDHLYHTELQVLLAADHPLAGRAHVSIQDLIDEPMVLYESNPHRPFSTPALGRLHPATKVKYHTSDFELMRSLVAHGAGYSLVMNPMPTSISFDGLPLARLALKPRIAGTSMAVIRPEGNWQHPGSREVIALAREIVLQGGLGADL